MRDDVTKLLNDVAAGTPGADDRLLDAVYGELRRLAHHHRARWRAGPLGTHSLVHEAYLKLVDHVHMPWQGRGQFFAIASRAMRSVLVDNARHWRRLKREGGRERIELGEGMLVSAARSEDVLALDAALVRLASAEARLASVVECRFFGGLTVEETAEALGLSPATVKRDWVTARTWLYRELHPDEPAHPETSS